MKSKCDTSPLFPERADDPGWPEPREARCAEYITTMSWYRIFWMMRDISRGSRYACEDAKRNEQRRRKQ